MRLSRRRAPISARVGRLVAAVAVAAAAALPRLAGATRAVSKVALSVVDDDATALAVSWYSAPGDVLGLGLSLAQFGPTRARLQEGVAEGYNYTFVDANTNRSYALHVAVMRGLVPGASYYYRVGDPTDGWSAISTFTATRTAASVTPATPFRVGMFGDAGWFGASAVPPLQTEAALGALDIVVSLGDQAYNLDYQNGNVGDQYLDALSSISSVVPLQGAVGNHVRLARSSAADCHARAHPPPPPSPLPLLTIRAGSDVGLCALHVQNARVCRRGHAQRRDPRRAGHRAGAAKQPLLRVHGGQHSIRRRLDRGVFLLQRVGDSI